MFVVLFIYVYSHSAHTENEGANLTLQDIQSNSVRFLKLHLKNYGIFLGPNEISFDRHCTLIIGMGGTGKTTIVNALANLGPAKGVKPHFKAKSTEMSIDVVTEGNRSCIKKYSSLIFLSHGFTEFHILGKESLFADILNNHQLEAVREEARKLFCTILFTKPWKIEAHEDLNPDIMAAGERICLGYAYAFAVRKVLNLDLPVVLDSPYGRLDDMLRNPVRAFLKEQSCQQIMFGCEHEFDEEDKPHYILDYIDGYSRVIKNI